jgi:hypothetical protein
MSKCEEVQKFMSSLVAACSEIGIPPEVALAIMLFETGSSLSAWYQANTNRRTAFGILQWTVAGCQPVAVQKAIGIPNPVANKAKADECYLKMQGLNRLEQLRGWKAYYGHWYKVNAKQWENIKDPYLKHYVMTLAPNGGPDYKDGNGVSARDLTSGKGVRGRNFAALKIKAADMLSGKIEVPAEDPKVQRFVGPGAAARYLRDVGGCKYTGGTSTAAAPPSLAPQAGSPEPRSIQDLLPVELQFTIPEYPALVGLKAGDVLILPPSSQLRDWVVASISRSFTAGMNMLTVRANRPLDPKPFVSAQALAQSPVDYMRHYYGG